MDKAVQKIELAITREFIDYGQRQIVVDKATHDFQEKVGEQPDFYFTFRHDDFSKNMMTCVVTNNSNKSFLAVFPESKYPETDDFLKYVNDHLNLDIVANDNVPGAWGNMRVISYRYTPKKG